MHIHSIKKHLKYTVTLLGAVLLISGISSCSLFTEQSTGTDLPELVAFSRVLDSVMNTFAADDDLTTGSKTIDPTLAETSYDILRDSAGDPLTPQEVYEKFQTGSETEVRVPKNNGSSGYITNFYGDPAKKAYFTMTPESTGSTDFYRIKLYILDNANLQLDYVYEEFIVDNSLSWWGYFSDEGTKTGLITSSDHFYDGTVLEHEILETLPESPSTNVYTIEVPSITETLTAYQYTIRSDYPEPTLDDAETVIPEIKETTTGSYGVFKYSHGNLNIASNPFMEKFSYYAEDPTAEERTYAVFSLQQVPNNTSNYIRTVERVKETYDQTASGYDFISKQVKALSTYSWRNDNPWRQITQEIDVTLNPDDTLHYESEEGTYYSGRTVDGDPDMRISMIIDEKKGTGNDKQYTGDMEITYRYSTWIDQYTVTYKNGELTTKKAKGKSKNFISIADEGAEIRVDLAYLRAGNTFTLELPGGGYFKGSYAGGNLVGTYTSEKGKKHTLELYNGVITLDNVVQDQKP